MHSATTATPLARVLQCCVFVAVVVWVMLLGGVGFSPEQMEASNDTSPIFNWHPVLMTTAFAVLMGEALLAYRAPVIVFADRQHRKLWHFSLHTSALAAGTLGVIAAIKSHTLKQPTPIPNFYSPHSYLGILACVLFLGQYILGLTAYLWPRWQPPARQALTPYHRFLGLMTFFVGLATMAVGVQEKTTFVQLGAKAGVRSAVITIPAVLLVLLASYAAAVAYHFAAPAPGSGGSAGHQGMHPEAAAEWQPLHPTH